MVLFGHVLYGPKTSEQFSCKYFFNTKFNQMILPYVSDIQTRLIQRCAGISGLKTGLLIKGILTCLSKEALAFSLSSLIKPSFKSFILKIKYKHFDEENMMNEFQYIKVI